MDTPHKDATRLILSICEHGVEDSWATKRMIEKCCLSMNDVKVSARGIKPQHETPRKHHDGTLRGVNLTLDEIRSAQLLVVHRSNLSRLKQRFGEDFVNQLKTNDRLFVRTGRECQFVDKNTSNAKKHVRAIGKVYQKKISKIITSSKTIDETLPDKIFIAAEKSNKLWQQQGQRKPKKKREKRTQKQKRANSKKWSDPATWEE